MVVCSHSALPSINSSNLDSIFLSTWSYINTPDIGIFFMLSGALLLPTTITNFKDFLHKRFSRILFPTIFWTIIYLAIKVFSGTFNSPQIAHAIFSFPFSAQGHGVLWFMYTVAGLYLLIPILSPWIKQSSPRQMLFYIGIWTITLSFPYLTLFLSINLTNTSLYYYFSGYIGYFILGAFLSLHMKGLKAPITCIIIILIMLLIPAPIKLLDYNIDFYSMFWHLSLPVATMTVAWFILARSFPKPKKNSLLDKFLNWFKPMTFGIYLSHIFFRNIFHQCFSDFPTILGTFLTLIATFSSALLLCAILRVLPFSKYTIGLKQQKNP